MSAPGATSREPSESGAPHMHSPDALADDSAKRGQVTFAGISHPEMAWAPAPMLEPRPVMLQAVPEGGGEALPEEEHEYLAELMPFVPAPFHPRLAMAAESARASKGELRLPAWLDETVGALVVADVTGFTRLTEVLSRLKRTCDVRLPAGLCWPRPAGRSTEVALRMLLADADADGWGWGGAACECPE